MKRIKFLILILFFVNSLYSYYREKFIKEWSICEKIEYGEINWSDGIIKVIGKAELPKIIDKNLIKEESEDFAINLAEARLKAFKKAEEKAFESLFAALHNIRIYDEYFFLYYLQKSETEFNFNFENFVRENMIEKKIYNPDKSVSVEITLKLFGEKGLLNIFNSNDNLFFFNSTNFSLSLASSSNEFTVVPQEYTSIIVDAKDIKGYFPSLSPSIVDEEGNLIYSSKFVYKESAIKKGIVQYISDEKYLDKIDFVDEKAFLLKGIKLGKNCTEIVIPTYIKSQLFSSEKTFKHLKNCNVVIITR